MSKPKKRSVKSLMALLSDMLVLKANYKGIGKTPSRFLVGPDQIKLLNLYFPNRQNFYGLPLELSKTNGVTIK